MGEGEGKRDDVLQGPGAQDVVPVELHRRGGRSSGTDQRSGAARRDQRGDQGDGRRGRLVRHEAQGRSGRGRAPGAHPKAEAVLGLGSTTTSSTPPSEESVVVESLVSAGRFQPFLDTCGDDVEQAVEPYQWSVRLVGACFEAFHDVEVVVRRSVDRETRQHRGEEQRGIPWFLLPVEGEGGARFEDSVSEVRKRLRRQGEERESRDQVVAGLDFGFWSELFHSGDDELWKKVLPRAFPRSSGKRADVVAVLEALRLFRNRLAHHDSLLQVDVGFRVSQVRDVLGWVDPRAQAWFDRVERVTGVLRDRPIRRSDDDDVVVVAALRRRSTPTSPSSTGGSTTWSGRTRR